MGEQTHADLKQTILEVVERQIEIEDPPETRQTLDRLLAAGYRRDQAVQLIGSAVLEEVWHVLHDHRKFELKHFRALLAQVG